MARYKGQISKNYGGNPNYKEIWNEGKKSENGFVDFKGEYFSIKDAKLYTPPHSDNIPLYMAAVGPEAIKIAALHCDGLITVTKADQSREILDQFNKSAKDAGKDPFSLEKIAKPKICYSTDYDKAFKHIEFWRATLLEDVFNTEISDPRQLEEKAKKEVSDEQLKKVNPISTSIEDCIKPIEEYFNSFIDPFGSMIIRIFHTSQICHNLRGHE